MRIWGKTGPSALNCDKTINWSRTEFIPNAPAGSFPASLELQDHRIKTLTANLVMTIACMDHLNKPDQSHHEQRGEQSREQYPFQRWPGRSSVHAPHGCRLNEITSD